MSTENIQQIKEMITTLNLESETTAEIVHELMPLLWWKFVWLPIAKSVLFFVGVLIILYLAYRLFVWAEENDNSL